MRFLFIAFSIVCLLGACSSPEGDQTPTQLAKAEPSEKPAYAIAIHGGAGTILKENMTPEKEKAYQTALNEALTIGEDILKEGGDALDAVVQTIEYLENSPLFNAGKGAVFTNAGENELDASIMDGRDQNAGAIGGVKTIKNPIKAARAVMEKSAHVLLTGAGAEAFAKSQGIESIDPSYFHTDARWESLERAKAKEEAKTGAILLPEDYKYGTVGCVVLDKNGNLAAGTSTGGMTNKRYNRIGDSPIIGAGTYADNNSCAVSCTGHGEYFIRYAVAYDLAARLTYTDATLEEAAGELVNSKLVEKGGSGGLISVDKNGNVAMPFNTPGMYRGYAKPGEREIGIYK